MPTSNPASVIDSVRSKKKQNKSQATQRFLPIAEIHDNTVVLKNGGVRAVLQTSSVNFNLKSEDEQNALIYGYQGFLNSLEFPVQMLIRSKRLNIDDYLHHLDTLKHQQENLLLKEQTAEYQEYIEKLIEYADIMEKKFYVVVPVDPATGTGIGFIDRFIRALYPDDTIGKARARRKNFKKLRKKLTQRVNQIEQALLSMNIRSRELNTQELIELYYQSYNPILSRYQKADKLESTSLENK